MASCDYNCTELPEHEKVQCGAYRKGGIVTVGVLECDHSITNFSNATQANQAINDGKLTLITGVKAEYPDATPIEGENPLGCGSATILDGFDHVLNIQDYNVTSANDSFFEALNKRTTYLVWYYCQEEEIRVVEKKVTWVCLPAASPMSNKEKQKYTVTAKWSSGVDEFPTLYTAPSNIYE
jgi:hypothetical protein